MADNLLIKDGTLADRTIRTTEAGGIHTPHHIVEGVATEATLDAINDKLPTLDGTDLPVILKAI